MARTTHRFTLDSDRQLAKLAAATAPLNGQLIRTDAESLVRLVSGLSESASMPREVVLELTTRRATRPAFAPAGHMAVERADLSTRRPDIVSRLRQELAAHDRQLAKPLWPALLEEPIRIDVAADAPWRPGQEYVYWPN